MENNDNPETSDSANEFRETNEAITVAPDLETSRLFNVFNVWLLLTSNHAFSHASDTEFFFTSSICLRIKLMK